MSKIRRKKKKFKFKINCVYICTKIYEKIYFMNEEDYI